VHTPQIRALAAKTELVECYRARAKRVLPDMERHQADNA
jgi:hypothetical protein